LEQGRSNSSRNARAGLFLGHSPAAWGPALVPQGETGGPPQRRLDQPPSGHDLGDIGDVLGHGAPPLARCGLERSTYDARTWQTAGNVPQEARVTPDQIRVQLDVDGVGSLPGVADPGSDVRVGSVVRVAIDTSRIALLASDVSGVQP